MSLAADDLWFAAVGTGVFVLMLAFPLSIWRRCGKDAHRLLKNDPTYGFFVPLVFPLAMGTFAKMVANDPVKLGLEQWILASVFAVFGTLAVMLTIADMKIGPVEPYMLRGEGALAYDTTMRGRIHTLFRRIHMDALADDEKKTAIADIRGLQQTANEEYGTLARGFQSWRDFRDRGSASAWAQVIVNLFVSLCTAALFAWMIHLCYRAMVEKFTPKTTADASMLVVGLLMLWFPLRLYSEWYTNFYTFRSLREYWTFWFLGLVGVVGLLLTAIVLHPNGVPIALSAFGSALLLLFGVVAKLKPQALGYAAVVFEEMPLVPFVLTMVLGLFAVLLTIVVSVT